MVGFLANFFFFASLWTEKELRSINTQKRTWAISNYLDRTSLVNKGFIILVLRKLFLRDKADSPARAANHSAKFD